MIGMERPAVTTAESPDQCVDDALAALRDALLADAAARERTAEGEEKAA